MNKPLKQSGRLFKDAQLIFPGGVNSPVRAFRAVGGQPIVVRHARGAYLSDADGNRFLDYVMSWGPLIGGHGFGPVIRAITRQLRSGISYGVLSEQEVEFGRLIRKCWPSIERLRMVSSGTEATMSAIRVARAFTKKTKIIKFDGCYHGHADYLLVSGGSGLATYGLANSAGIDLESAKHTLVAAFNDLESVDRCFKTSPGEIAAVIVEPVVGNMGTIQPVQGFLRGLRDLCQKNGALLIMDEVMTGFRLSIRGAEGVFDVAGDLVCLGKILGAGLPCGAYGGRADIMKLISPEGPVYQAGTLSGNPLAMAAGRALLKELLRRNPRIYRDLDQKTEIIKSEAESFARSQGIPLLVQKMGSMFTFFFTEKSAICNYEEVKKTRTELFPTFFSELLAAGVFIPPSNFEAAFMSMAHGEREIEKTLRAVKGALRKLSI